MTVPGATLPVFRAEVDETDPQIFLNPDESAAAINQDGSVNYAANPAPAGSIVSIWATGTGAAGTDGRQASAPVSTFCCGLSNGTAQLNVTYAGPSPGMVNGVTQINFQIPASVTTDTKEYFLLSVGSGTSDQAFVYVSP